MTSNVRASLLALALATSLVPSPDPAIAAEAQTKLKFVLNWKYQGPQGIFFLAEDRGYFKSEGLDLTIDQGSGSGAPIATGGKRDL